MIVDRSFSLLACEQCLTALVADGARTNELLGSAINGSRQLVWTQHLDAARKRAG
jgi:hypothetical protein